MFDFDGTLLDNFHAVHITVKELMSSYGLLSPSEKQFRARVCLPFASTAYHLGLSGIPESVLKSTFLEIYQRHMRGVRLFPDVMPTLRKLQNSSIRTGVVTDAPRFLFSRYLDDLNLHGYFDVTVSGDDTKERKPSSLPLLKATKRLGHIQQSEVMYVGDMAEDIVAARRAGILACAIYRRGRNFHSLTRLRNSAPGLIVTSLKQLTQGILP